MGNNCCTAKLEEIYKHDSKFFSESKTKIQQMQTSVFISEEETHFSSVISHPVNSKLKHMQEKQKDKKYYLRGMGQANDRRSFSNPRIRDLPVISPLKNQQRSTPVRNLYKTEFLKEEMRTPE